jgi:ATP-dependent exoDNAse (exonuclease V) beta subunit
MGVGTLTIYSASAGSGKTHQLAGIYLEKLFKSRLSYRRILAVTFTHKATAEMKTRILDELNRLAVGQNSKYLAELLKSTGRTEGELRREAREILYSILHDFSRFSVSTIDSFYQKIVRAFSREIGLHSGFNIEIDHTAVLETAVENLIASAASDITIKNWLSMYARANIEEEKSWDLKKNIIGLAGELFSEKFKLLSSVEKEKIQDKEFLKSYIKEMRSILITFNSKMRDIGLKCLGIFDRYSLRDEMFYQKGRGIPGFIKSNAGGDSKPPNSYVRAITDNPPKWSSGIIAAPLADAISSGLEKSVKEAINYYDDNILSYKTAREILSNIYILGILSDVLNQVHHITRDENIFLLSDAGELIYLITEKDQTPFIYEKVGNTFENFMIDEFQDTSIIQWKNFRQLIDNSMSQGFENLVVGDIKQSIYRWRNSDWKTLRDLKKEVDDKRYISHPLNTNYRSCSNIIRFNNALFSIIPHQIDAEMSDHKPETSFRNLFSEAVQIDPGEKNDGYVRIEFLDNTDGSAWMKTVLTKLPSFIELIQDKGFHASDIGILVRDNNEGAVVLKEIINYSLSCPEEKKKQYNYNIVSGESLLLVNSTAVNFIIAVLKVLENPENMIGRALMLRYYLLATGRQDAEKIPLNAESLVEYSAGFLPEGYDEFLTGIRYMPLWNITEMAISFFGLGNYSSNVSYLNSFQDIVINYTSARNPGIASFLEWWESEGIKKSILLPEQQDSMKVLTIHKSKGLEFGVVILPFISWNLDHKSFHSNILWATPVTEPFNKLGIVPVRYKGDLAETIFADQYYEEKYSAYLDNINLLYVAFTRAVNAIIGFAPDKPRPDNRIAAVIRDAITFQDDNHDVSDSFLCNHFDRDTGVFEYGIMPEIYSEKAKANILKIKDYQVNDNTKFLKLKLHWENYFDPDRSGARERINYGKMMHEIFGEIVTTDDVPGAVKKKVIEGKIPEEEEESIREKVQYLVSRPGIKDWFEKGNIVLNEASILMPDSVTKRPDRIIMREGKATIIDFKFGEESPSYLYQVRQYRKILTDMGCNVVHAYLWFVDGDKIVSA